MKKKLMSAMATALALTMALPSTAFATSSGQVTALQGTVTLEAPVFSVLLPTAVALVMNPMEMKDSPGIYSSPITVANKSTAAVTVEAQITTVIPTAAVMAPTALGFSPKEFGAVNVYDDTNKNKEFSLRVRPIDATVAGGIATTDMITTAPTATVKVPDDAMTPLNLRYATTANTWVLPAAAGEFSLNNKSTNIDAATSKGNYVVPGVLKAATGPTGLLANAASMTFLLDEFPSTTATASTAAFTDTTVLTQASGFVFEGELNSFASWTATDIKATVVFTFSGLSSKVADALESSIPVTLDSDALNVVSFKHGAAATAGSTTSFAAAVGTKIPYVTNPSPAVAHTSTLSTSNSGAVAVDLNPVMGAYTVENATMYNTRTGKTYTIPLAKLAFVASADGDAAATLTLVADALDNTLFGVASLTAANLGDYTGTYKVAVPLVSPDSVKTTVFFTFNLTE